MVRLKDGQSIDQATDAIRSLQPQIRDATLPTDWPAIDLEQYLKAPLDARCLRRPATRRCASDTNVRC